ncbi:MAG: hypothetical protein RL653_66 [Pseudomonadota bacterium]
MAGALLVPGFPAAWLVAGKKRGLDAAVRHVVKTYKAGILELLAVKIIERLRRAEWIERYNQGGMRATLNELLPRYLVSLEDLPAPVRPLLRAVVRRVDVGGFLLKVFEERTLAELDPDEVAAGAAARANEFIDDKLLTVSWLPVWLVLGANLLYVAGLFVAAR